jgi:hypothetical protein
MESQTLPMAHFRLLAESLAIGLLIGVERYKARRPGERGFGSVRTFAVIGLVGGVCGLLHTTAFTATAFGALAVLVTVAFSKEWETNSGLTTEVAALTVFWLAYLVRVNETLAVSAAIVLAILLASKHALHGFLADSVSERELFDTLKFLAVVFVVYPLLPDRSLGPWGFFNPARVWLMIVLVSSVSYAGYLLVRWLGPNRGVLLSGLAGGLVSTTATTLALAGRTKKAPKSSEFLGLTGGLANSVQLPKILVLISVVNYNLGVELAPLLIAGAAAGLVALGAIVLSHPRASLRSNLRGRSLRCPGGRGRVRRPRHTAGQRSRRCGQRYGDLSFGSQPCQSRLIADGNGRSLGSSGADHERLDQAGARSRSRYRCLRVAPGARFRDDSGRYLGDFLGAGLAAQ